MISQWKKALVAVAFAVFAPLSIAQAITVPGGHGGSVAGGTSISVGFSDSNRADELILITVSNNQPGPLYEEVVLEIKLGANGKGSVEWLIPSDWEEAVFFGGGAMEMQLNVT